MSLPMIEVERLSKRYRLGTIGSTSLREEFARRWQTRGKSSASARDFWALRDVSFSVQAGEVLGVLGRNGAGKSTLLKILSRITEPTAGEARLRGRVASLLEVGTGFHPDLSGRENIFLNGAILGMTRAEIRRKFDEIVAFAGVEQFIDTPVKRFSSGMYVRLAFAVAAHLEPEILIVDEVLAVGDAEFQKKCLGKMEDVAAKDGRTVLFVSHNLAAMQSLCKTGILLEHGRVAAVGTIQSVSEKYSVSSTVAHPRGRKDFAAEDHPGKIREARILALSTTDAAGACRGEFLAGEALAVVIEFESHTSLPQGVLGCQVRTSQGVPLFTSYSSDGGSIQEIRPGRHAWVCHIDLNPLMPGVYFLECGVANRSVHVIDLKTDELSFEILDKPGFRRQPIEGRAGPLYLDFRWRAKP